MTPKEFYALLPCQLQNAAVSLEGLCIQHRRYGGNFGDLLCKAKNRTFWPAEKIQEYRDKRLKAFIRHCVESVPFYKRKFREMGIIPEDIKELENLRIMPILTKEEVQDHSDELLSTAVSKKEMIINHTSGTTGGGLRFATTSYALQEQWATWWRYRCWHGLNPGTWCGYFGGRSVVPLSQIKPPFWRYNVPGRQIFFSGYHMNTANMRSYVDELRRKRPQWLHGYPSLLSLLASYIFEKGIDLGYAVHWITIGSENLLPQQTDIIERAFSVRPLQHYGMAEAVANISECEHGSLHVDEDFAAVEFVPHTDGQRYKVIGTNFTNPATPLVRYDILDLVTLPEQNLCPCGRPGRVVQSIDGRKEDYIILKKGTKLGRMDHIFKNMVNIREAQVYQETPGVMTIRVVRNNNYRDQDETMLLQETLKRVGNDTEIHIEYVEKLERSRTGKLRFVVSEIEEGKI